MKLAEQLLDTCDEAKGVFSGLVGDFYYVMKLPSVDTDALTSSLPNQLKELQKVKNFMSNAHVDYARSKNTNNPKKAVLDFVKQLSPKQFVARWYKTDKDDAIAVYYA
jgi:hypothetical protein